MHVSLPLACFLSVIRPPGIQFETGLLQIAPVDKSKCPFIHQNDIIFQLYTRHNSIVAHELVLGDDEKLFASSIDFHIPTVLYFPAFLEMIDTGSALMVKEAYMVRGDHNVIMVDSSRLQAGPWYPTAAENTWFVGQYAARFIDYLVSRGLDLSKTHLVGHSLGGQVAGVAGSAIKSGRIARITALDPALPLFGHLPPQQRLDPSDAEFVDVIHTDAGIFGQVEPVGHADFFPNGGISPQPGCELETVIPKQLLLTICDKHTTPGKYYTVFLKPNTQTNRRTKKILEYLQTKPILMRKRGFKTIKGYKKAAIHVPTYYQLNKNTKTQMQNLKDLEAGIENTQFVQKELDYNDDDLKTDADQVMSESELQVYLNKPAIETDPKNHEIIPQDIKNTENLQETESLQQAINTDIHNESDLQVYSIKSDIEDSKNVSPDKQNAENLQVTDSQEQAKKTDTFTESDFQIYSIKPDIETEVSKTVLQDKQNTANLQEANNKETQKTTHKPHVNRQKRFLPFLKQTEAAQNDNFLFKMLEFLVKNRRSVIPVFTVMREINTLVKSGNGELNHFSKERNNYIGAQPPVYPVSYNLELGGESRAVVFLKRLLGLTPKGDRLSITGAGK